MSEEEKVTEVVETNADAPIVESAEEEIVPPPEETAQIEKEEPKNEAKPKPKPTPEELSPKDLYGRVPGPVRFYNLVTRRWEAARWQPPYPTPKSLEPYVVQKGDKIWLIAEKYGVTNAWIRRCNSIDYLDQNKLKPGKVLKFTYTPSNRDKYVNETMYRNYGY